MSFPEKKAEGELDQLLHDKTDKQTKSEKAATLCK